MSTIPTTSFSPTGALPTAETAGSTSAKQYIPEQPSNSSDQANNQQPFTPTFVQATGGGVSTLGQTSTMADAGADRQPSTGGSGRWNFDDRARGAGCFLFRRNYTNGSDYIFASMPSDCVNGTPDTYSTRRQDSSLAASAFAGVAALVVQAHGAQGNLNNGLYATPAAVPGAFHDVTAGTNKVSCAPGSPDCGADSFTSGYNAGAGYDAASGLGSVDVASLISGWRSTIGGGGATITLSLTEMGRRSRHSAITIP